MARNFRRKQDEETNYWLSYSDMMAGLLLTFVLVIALTVLHDNIQFDMKQQELLGTEKELFVQADALEKEKALAAENMERMGITDLAKRCYRDLSGGQQQRVLLARALCAARKLLLLDEPVSGLDPRVTLEMYELISRLNKEGITILMISHDIDAAVQYATHVLHVGKHIFFGTKEEYLNSDAGRYFVSMERNETTGGEQ